MYRRLASKSFDKFYICELNDLCKSRIDDCSHKGVHFEKHYCLDATSSCMYFNSTLSHYYKRRFGIRTKEFHGKIKCKEIKYERGTSKKNG